MTSNPSVQIPDRLQSLLRGSEYESCLNALVQKVGTILARNSLPFFPGYTDHGVNHINDVLASIIELIPEKVWGLTRPNSAESLLSAADAAVIIGATLLHDIAMFLQVRGFKELITQPSRFKPLKWFDREQQGYAGDMSWTVLWNDYEREIRRFGVKQLSDIIGEEAAATWRYQGLPPNPGDWTESLRLVIGEFLRRHHARLAHEIAIYGFPGIDVRNPSEYFPAIGEAGQGLCEIADLIGLTARSHGINLRVCTAYLRSEFSFPDDLRPHGCAVVYPMALLRVADYLQLDKPRAPAVLLQLIDPQSRVSVNEWTTHAAVTRSAAAADPTAIFLRVKENIALPTFLQIESLFGGFQRELDHSTAVLSETYGSAINHGLDQLRLSKSRVASNLLNPEFQKKLPYIPRRTGFSADPHLLPLLVGPLYGNNPSVAIRELMQNSVDAVRELEALCSGRNCDPNSLERYHLANESEVAFEFIEQEENRWILRVTDRGIGMRGDTIANYFLRAGATFKNSKDWSKDFTDEEGRSRITKTGRFGIGVFAIFLLGPTFKLWTRHVDDSPSCGSYLEASEQTSLIEVHRKPELQVGTRIEIVLYEQTVDRLCGSKFTEVNMKNASEHFAWYCWDWPRITFRFAHRREGSLLLESTPNWPLKSAPDNLQIHVITEEFRSLFAKYPSTADYFESTVGPASGFPRRIFWTFSELGLPPLSLNGFHITDNPYYRNSWDDIGWSRYTSLDRPYLSIDDPDGVIAPTIVRDRLQNVEEELIRLTVADITLSLIAHALVAGPLRRSDINTYRTYHPSVWRPVEEHPDLYGRLCSHGGLFSRWVCSSTGIVPFDPWAIRLLETSKVRIYGVLSKTQSGARVHRKTFPDEFCVAEFVPSTSGDSAICFFHGQLSARWNNRQSDVTDFPMTLDLLMEALRSGETMQISVGCMFMSVPQSNLAISQGVHVKSLTDVPNILSVGFGGEHDTATAIELTAACLQWREHIVGMQKSEPGSADDGKMGVFEPVVFVADLVAPSKPPCTTPLARFWEAALGSKAIPFDTAARREMVERASQNPLLCEHIRKWQQIMTIEGAELG